MSLNTLFKSFYLHGVEDCELSMTVKEMGCVYLFNDQSSRVKGNSNSSKHFLHEA